MCFLYLFFQHVLLWMFPWLDPEFCIQLHPIERFPPYPRKLMKVKDGSHHWNDGSIWIYFFTTSNTWFRIQLSSSTSQTGIVQLGNSKEEAACHTCFCDGTLGLLCLWKYMSVLWQCLFNGNMLDFFHATAGQGLCPIRWPTNFGMLWSWFLWWVKTYWSHILSGMNPGLGCSKRAWSQHA